MSSPGPFHGRSQKWQQLLQVLLQSPPSAQLQTQVSAVLASDPLLMAAFVNLRSASQQHQQPQMSMNGVNVITSPPQSAWHQQQQQPLLASQQQPTLFQPPMYPQCQHMPIPTNFGDQLGFQGQQSSDDIIICYEKPVGSGPTCVEKVAEDMGKLLVSGEKSDITVKVKGTEFQVHSLILCARSPVLSAMLEHDTAERASNRITVDDCEPDVFGEYLRYIYTGSVRFLSRQTVFGLYRVADKYLADDLKLLCLEHVQNTLCVETFCDTVKLSLMHEEKDLFQRAVNFASHHFPSIVISVEWKDFILECPLEANEILTKCFGPRGKK